MSILTGKIETKRSIREFLGDGGWKSMDELCAVLGKLIPFEYALHWWDRRRYEYFSPKRPVKVCVESRVRSARRLILAQRVRHMVLAGEMEAVGFGRDRRVRRIVG